VTTIIEQKGIGTVIRSTKLSVPRHQRSFEWTEEHVGELLSDLDGAMARGQAEYFLGSIVVIGAPGSDRDEVLDGQQRLATVSLLLASIWTWTCPHWTDGQGLDSQVGSITTGAGLSNGLACGQADGPCDSP